MNKHYIVGVESPNNLKRVLKIMKITLFLLFFCILFSQATNSFSQETEFTLHLKSATIKDVCAELEKRSDYRFIFAGNANKIINKKVNVSADSEDIEKILENITANTELAYRILGNQVVIYHDSSKTPTNEIAEIILEQAAQQQKKQITGRVVDAQGEPIIGANIVEAGTTNGTVTDIDGNYSLSVEDNATLQISYIGYLSQNVNTAGRTNFNITLLEDTQALDELVVVGYGMQRKSDITGSVSSLNKERLEMVPNINVAQALQGSVPGIMVLQSSAGAAPNEVIMIRGRNSILADNAPLIIVDGIPYGGQIRDISPNDVESIEILKDASAAAIYGSRGSNGVILITTKNGTVGKTTLSYDGYYSIQRYSNLPTIMKGDEFYKFKEERFPGQMSQSEKEIYESGKWVNWLDLGLQNGYSHQHNLSVSGGLGDTKYFISGGFLDVKGLLLNDLYKRITTRVNVDTKVANLLTIGTRTQFSFDDRSGASPSISGLLWTNPLTTPYDDMGKLTIYPWPEDLTVSNPLQGLLYKDVNKSYQVINNNFAIVDIPFINGLSYRINTGLRYRFTDTSVYRGRDTASGLSNRSSTDVGRSIASNTVIENIISYNQTFNDHNVFFTGLYSFEGNKSSSNNLYASGFPHDFLTFYSAAQAELINPEFSNYETNLISQMLRLNYSYAGRYLLTITGRRDGFSGFGSERKWGLFPSIALGWNLVEDKVVSIPDFFDTLKLRASWGLNGNQAVGAYESISRLSSEDIVDRKVTLPGYRPSRLGQDQLGWESSKTVNIGVDFSVFKSRISGELNWYKTNTNDLLLSRTISPIHGINSITQNIGKTENRGIDGLISTKNINSKNFQWNTSFNFAFVKNKIKSLYGYLDENGNEVDDIVNSWFIDKPIRVIYDFVWDGTWQLNEAAEAEKWGTKPGYLKLKDSNKDGKLNADDKEIIGQRDPKFLWGMTNSFLYRQFQLDIFIHGVHGVTKSTFPLHTDLETFSVIRRNTTKKDWWTPDNPTNDFVMNHLQAEYMSGIRGYKYESADFIRLKDVSLSYELPKSFFSKTNLSRIRLYINGRNLFTSTKWRGFDPELDNIETIPLQKEYVIGLNVGF